MPRALALLAGLFDYAAHVGPDARDLDLTLTRFAHHQAGPDGWMLGRLVVPAADLAAVTAWTASRPRHGQRWRICAHGSLDGAADRAALLACAMPTPRDGTPVTCVDALILPATLPADVRAATEWCRRGFDVYCEASLDAAREAWLDALARNGLHAVVRLPTMAGPHVCADMARLLCACAARGVAVTLWPDRMAALHPQLPSRDAPAMPGYLNLVLAAGVAEGAGRAAALSDDVRRAVARVLAVSHGPVWVGHASLDWRDQDGPLLEGPLATFSQAGRALVRAVVVDGITQVVADARRLGLISGAPGHESASP